MFGPSPKNVLGQQPQQHRRCSHVAKVHTNNKRRMPQPGDENEERHRWLERSLVPKPRPSLHKQSSTTQQQQQQQEQLDWRSYRAKLVQLERSSAHPPAGRSGASRPVRPSAATTTTTFNSAAWAHELPGPEPGCLLVARQDGMAFFDRAVVLLGSHDPVLGSVGFVLNKPCPLKLAEVQGNAAAQGVLETFGSQQLQLGGPVQLDNLTVLHSYAGLAGAHKVSEGVFFGGVPAAVELVRCGLAKPHNFRLMLGVSGWAPGQLQEEIDTGAWHVVAAAKELVLPSPFGAQSKSSEKLFERLLKLIGRTHPCCEH